jgi:hypothetical protein
LSFRSLIEKVPQQVPNTRLVPVENEHDDMHPKIGMTISALILFPRIVNTSKEGISKKVCLFSITSIALIAEVRLRVVVLRPL